MLQNSCWIKFIEIMFPMFNDSCKFMQGIRKRIKMLVFSDGGKNHIQNQKKTKND